MPLQSRKIHVFVIDDSPITRDLAILTAESDPNIAVMGYAANETEALKYFETLKPEVIFIRGSDNIEKFIQQYTVQIVAICNPSETFQVIKAGAFAIIEPPDETRNQMHLEVARFIMQMHKVLADLKAYFSKSRSSTSSHNLKGEAKKIHAVAIGASIGGPQALYTILSKLPASFPAPIFVAQQITTGLIQGLVNWLSESTSLRVSLGQHGEKAGPGCVYIAPDNMHMEVLEGNIISLTQKQEIEENTPSISKLFSSITRTHGTHAIGVLLTGLGHDGAKELLKMKELGAITITQDEETSVVFELPQEAIRLGAATNIEPIQQIPVTLNELAGI